MSKLGLVGVNSKCGVQSKRRCESHESCVCIVGSDCVNAYLRHVTHGEVRGLVVVHLPYLSLDFGLADLLIES